jgi:hypothetical protein
MTKGYLVALLAVGSIVVSCGKKSTPHDDDIAIRPVSPPAVRSAAVAASSVPPGAPTGTMPPFGPKVIDAGAVREGGAWLPKFTIRRDDGDTNKPFLDAYKACADRGMALCSVAQWERACSVDSQLGAIETWTLSASGAEGFIVRGGGGCSSSKVVPGHDQSVSRAGVCCDRAVAITTTNRNKAFLMTVADKMLRYENGLNKKSGAALSPYIDDSISFFGRTYDHDQMVAKYDSWFRQWPDQWTVYEACDVTLQGSGDDATWTADCPTTTSKAGEVAAVTTRYLWTARGKVQRIEETKVHRKFSAP